MPERPEDVQLAKQQTRERVWELLESRGAARWPGARGRIPNFRGAEAAAERLAGLEEWKAARVIKANPDAPQLPARARALADGKLLYMAVPRLAEEHPFVELDPGSLTTSARGAASIRGASRAGRKVSVDDMRRVDLVLCGSVAVNGRGSRVGKGGGYSDLEFALLVEAGLVDAATVLVTTVHGLQVLDEDLPETAHDFRLRLVVTPEAVISCPPTDAAPAGILWDHLDDAKLASIPVLAALAGAPKEDAKPSARRGGRRAGR